MRAALTTLLLASAAWGQISFDASSNAGTENNKIWSHTVGGACSNAVLIVKMMSAASTGTGCTLDFNGATMTRVTGAAVSSGTTRQDTYVLAGPATGTHTITASSCSGGDYFNMAASFCGVDQTTPVEASNAVANGGGATGANPSIAVTSVTGNAWAVYATVNNSFQGSLTPNCTGGGNLTYNGWGGYISSMQYTGPISPAGSTTCGWTAPNGNWSRSAIALKPASGAAAPVKHKVIGGQE